MWIVRIVRHKFADCILYVSFDGSEQASDRKRQKNKNIKDPIDWIRWYSKNNLINIFFPLNLSLSLSRTESSVSSDLVRRIFDWEKVNEKNKIETSEK